MDQISPTIATGHELELLNSLIERMSELYEFPESVKAHLALVSDSIQEQAVDLDTIDSFQTAHGPLRRWFSAGDLVRMQALVIVALEKHDEARAHLDEFRRPGAQDVQDLSYGTFIQKYDLVMKALNKQDEMRADLVELLKMLGHPDA